MTPARQIVFHDPSTNSYGDRTRACVAALLDLAVTDVPHFADHDVEEWSDAIYWNRIDDFLRGHGLTWVGIPVTGSPADVLATMEHNNPGVYYIIGCRSRIAGHHVVCCGDRIVCDPSDYADPEHFTADPTGLTWVHFLVPTRLKEAA